MKNAKKNLADAKNPLTILFKILANALLEDESGIHAEKVPQNYC
jgi:hypothetical protein